ncbi:alpha/beta hydrolase [Litoribacter populi]|uniref:alpha/beta hydrolase n=1 Tax=Litoribacter populi TaxID=2598460 RepID=UPI00117E4A1F|nr:alpha/beta hydrolase-fold protein [Litoribacter populi]
MKYLFSILCMLIAIDSWSQETFHRKIVSSHLGEMRDVWITIPSDYDSINSYPVLYMHDGQNLAYDSLAFAGTWDLKNNLLQLEEEGLKFIVVGIANGGEKRMAELSWFFNPDHSSGKGRDYLNFIVEEVMPEIESTFHIDKERIGIFGSSLGGLISIQAMVEFPEIFSMAGVFSPAFWFNPQTMDQYYLSQIKPRSRIYMISGAKEVYGEINFPEDQKKVDSTLNSHLTKSQYYSKIHEDGEHKEWYWAREFNDAIRFLLKEK